MFRWHHFPFIRFSIFLIIGILLYEYPGIKIHFLIAFFLLLPVFLLVFRSSSKILKGLLAGGLLVTTGFGVAFVSDPFQSTHHYTRVDGEIRGFEAVVVSQGEVRGTFVRYELELNKVLSDSMARSVEGRIYLYAKDSLIRYRYGDGLIVTGAVQQIESPKNPHEFNYKQFVRRKGIAAATFADPEEIYVIGSTDRNPIFAFSYKIRKHLVGIFQNLISESREREIALALILGIKDELSQETRQAYATAGAMHVLAVSGLHVGIIYLILSSILGKLLVSERTRIIKLILILAGIFAYAILTGMSASVMRASLMFSVVAVGNSAYRKSSVYNSLGIAAFTLLLIEPNLIYSVGFQLSFAAVLGIVTFFPFISKLVNSRYYLVNKIWDVTSVSIAAQLATFPFAVYYFNQFPTYFFLSNLVVIPAAFCVLIGGIGMIFLYSISFPLMLEYAWIYEKLIWLMNESIFLLEFLQKSLIDWIYLSAWDVCALYSALIFISAGLIFRSKSGISLGLLSLGFFFVNIQMRHWGQINQERLIVYGTDEVIIDRIKGTSSQLVSITKPPDWKKFTYNIDPVRRASGLDPLKVAVKKAQSFYWMGPLGYKKIGGIRFLYISKGMKNYRILRKIETDFLILDPKIEVPLSQWISQVKCSKILLPGNFPDWKAKQLRRLCSEKGISIHHLNEDGFLDLS